MDHATQSSQKKKCKQVVNTLKTVQSPQLPGKCGLNYFKISSCHPNTPSSDEPVPDPWKTSLAHHPRGKPLGLRLNKPRPGPPQPLADRGTPPVHPNTPSSSEPVPDPGKTPPAYHKVSTFNCKHPQSLPRTQEQPVTLGRRGPKSNQSPLEEEDPGAASHPGKKTTKEQSVTLRGRGPRSSQSPSEEEDPGAASHPQRKRTQEHPDTIVTRDLPCPLIQGRNGKTSMQKYIQQHKKQDITRI
ncbi:hypothetical protein STEG23_018164 [Scotinomys teguina]